MKYALRITMTVSAAAIFAACSKREPPVTVVPEPNRDSVAAVERERQDSALGAARREKEERERLAQQHADSVALVAQTARAAETARAVLTALIPFAYNEATLLAEAKELLDQKAAILWGNPDTRIRIEGHCDQRGSGEYNLTLGNRRAVAAKEYLVRRGVAANRIETGSYGEKRPLDPARTKQAWARNRRGEFEIVSGGMALTAP